MSLPSDSERFHAWAARQPSTKARLRAFWSRWFGKENPHMSDKPKPTAHHGDVDEFTHPNILPPRTFSMPDPWPGLRGSPQPPWCDETAPRNAPCCKVGSLDSDLEVAVSAELARILALFRERQAKYGPKNIAEFGEVGVLVRLYDKLARLRNFYFDGGVGDMADESVEDAWSDISCYAAIALVCKRGRWPGATPSRSSKDAL